MEPSPLRPFPFRSFESWRGMGGLAVQVGVAKVGPVEEGLLMRKQAQNKLKTSKQQLKMQLQAGSPDVCEW